MDPVSIVTPTPTTTNSHKPQQPDPDVNSIVPQHVFPSSQTKDVEGNQPTVQPSSIVEIPNSYQNHSHRKGSTFSIASSVAKGTRLLCIRMSEVFLSILVFLPLSIGMWRGIWQIMYPYYEPWVLMLIGNGLILTLYYFQEPLKEVVNHRKMNFPLFYVLSRTILLLHAFGSIVQWAGIWEVLNEETGDGPVSALVSLLVSIAIMILRKEFCNVLATPLVVGVDEATSLVDCPLRYQTPVNLKWTYFADCFWSAIVVQNLVIIAWRGLWNLANLNLFSEDKLFCAYFSFAVGNGIVILLSILQPCYFRFMISQNGIMRVAVADLVTAWGFTGCVLAWKGTWELQDHLIVFDQPLASEWLTAIVGTVGSILLGCLSTVTARGITVDGEDSGDGTVEWPISYISLLQQKRHHGIPFPEPWLLRYLCTSQRMLMTEPLTLRRTSTIGPTPGRHSIQHGDKSYKLDEDAYEATIIKNNSLYVDHFDGPKNESRTS